MCSRATSARTDQPEAGWLTPAEARRLHREAVKPARSCRVAELTPPVHCRAERLLWTSAEVPLRALDALHVALALGTAAATLVAYDPRRRRLRHA